jgi:hypothetical protein
MITIKSSISVHNGGTKFYQVYAIYGGGGASMPAIALHHYGKYNPGADITPGSHGTSELFLNIGSQEAIKNIKGKIADKKKRGYHSWTETVNGFTNETKLIETIKGIFNGKAGEILRHLEGTIQEDSDMGAPIEQAAEQPQPPAPPPSDEPIERGELWAQW